MELLHFFADNRNGFFDFLQTIGKNLGSEVVLIPLAALLYWCINRDVVYRIGFAFFTSSLFAQGLKVTFRIPRPWVLDPSLEPLEDAVPTATGYSFPSGHSQTAASVYGSIMVLMKHYFAKVIFLLLFVFVGLSRMYAGVHTPADVLAAFVLSLITVYIIHRMSIKRADKEKPYLPLAVLISVLSVLMLIYANVLLYATDLVTYENVHDLCTSAGSALAFAIAYFLEGRIIRFDYSVSVKFRILRPVIGALILGILYIGLKPILSPLQLFGDYLRYFLLLFFVTVVYPLIFTKIEK